MMTPAEETYPDTNSNNAKGVSKTRFWLQMGGLVVIAALIVGTIIGIAKIKDRNKARSIPAPTLSPTINFRDAACPNKQLVITEICNLPDLDDDIFGRDTTMEIKILVNDTLHWPQNTREDCLSEYGSYSGACVIPDTSLMGCFPLANSIPMEFGLPAEVGTFSSSNNNDQQRQQLPPASAFKITIYDEDIFSDDFIDFFLAREDWYFPNECEEQEIIVTESFGTSRRQSGGAYIKMITRPKPLTKQCGVDLEIELPKGLNDAAQAFDDVQVALEEYVRLEDRRLRRHSRTLFFGLLIRGAGLLVSGISSFAGIFAKGAKAQGPLSTLADMTTIGSALWNILGQQSDGSSPSNLLTTDDFEAWMEQVTERIDLIDVKLGGLQQQVDQGFARIELSIREGFARQEMDDWINGELGTLWSDYRAYRNPDHTLETRAVYEDIFRQSCRHDHSPYTIFQALYSHACDSCSGLGGTGRSQQYLLDVFLDLAGSSVTTGEQGDGLDEITRKVLWFRQGFGTIWLSALVQATYLHAVCLYQDGNVFSPEDIIVCPNEDPVWRSRLEEMGDALEEVSQHLVNMEERLDA